MDGDLPNDETLLAESPSPLASSTALDGGRFAPGTIVDARYRIVALLGRGGMGEVYRADDLKIGETVALKFLPESLAADGAALARFHREVRTARQITHRSVVRVHDIGEVDSMPFISMEYVDGEDLASLLKRIGRLPQDKAVELARQLCAGLAAAHERGVLHRDIKPANVMIDGEGRAKISDFGLADLAVELGPEIAGTPAYMAPEQLREGKTSFASDIYSLGLVLYEMFSGQHPFKASTRAQLMTLHDSTDPDALSIEVSGTDPLVDATLRRCLQRDPAQRPSSALDVAAALPGGDPLAAALAAGETPSPEMVARAQGAPATSRGIAAAALAGTLILMGVSIHYSSAKFAASIDPPLEPQVLAHRADELLRDEGWTGVDEAWGFEHNGFSIVGDDWYRKLTAWRELTGRRPAFYNFWLRSSVGPLMATQRWNRRPNLDDPPSGARTVATVVLDGRGRLRELFVPRAPEPDGNANEPSWERYFESAELSLADFEATAADRAPPAHAELVRAWRGTYPGQQQPIVRVDAASVGGAITWWRLEEEAREQIIEAVSGAARASNLVALSVFAGLWLVGGYFAHRHIRSGRGDIRGALRLALFVFASTVVSWILTAKHVSAVGELSSAFSALAEGLMMAAVFWLLYMTIEPFARRYFPKQLTSWARLLNGEVRDPLVGRDILIGLFAIFAVLALRQPIDWAFDREIGLIWRTPHGLASMLGAHAVVANLFHFMALLVPLGLLTVLVVTRALTRRPIPGFLVALSVVTLFYFAFQAGQNPDLLWGLAIPLLFVSLAYRVSFLALIASAWAVVTTQLVPTTLDTSLWWMPSSAISWGAVALVAVLAYRTAVDGSDRAPRRQPER